MRVLSAAVRSRHGARRRNIYYDASQPANAYLNGATYSLGNGGVLAAVTAVPEPVGLGAACLLGASLFTRRRRRVR